MDMFKKFGTKEWEALHRCFFEEKSAIGAFFLKQKEITNELSKFVTIGEREGNDLLVSMKDKRGLKKFLLQHASALKRVLKSWPYTLSQLCAILKFLMKLLQEDQLPKSKKPNSEWLDNQLRVFNVVEYQWVGRGKVVKLLAPERLESMIAFCEKTLARGNSIKKIIEEASSQRKGAQSDIISCIKRDLDCLRAVDGKLADRLEQNVKELIKAYNGK